MDRILENKEVIALLLFVIMTHASTEKVSHPLQHISPISEYAPVKLLWDDNNKKYEHKDVVEVLKRRTLLEFEKVI